MLNLTHRDGHAAPSPLVPGERYRVRLQLNDCGAALSGRPSHPAGALDGLLADGVARARDGDGDDPRRRARPAGAAGAAGESLAAVPAAETAPPDKARPVRPGVVRFDRIGLEIGSEGSYSEDIEGDDPLSATAGMRAA